MKTRYAAFCGRDFLARLNCLFDVDLEAGQLRRRVRHSNRPAGEIVGCVRPDGYLQVSIDNKTYLIHQVLAFVKYGFFPEQVDHINGIKSDNRASNLRPANAKLNARNQKRSSANKSGATGVRYRADRRSYEAYWKDEAGSTRYKHFRIDEHGGEAEAKEAAASYRRQALLDANSRGAGWSDRHLMS